MSWSTVPASELMLKRGGSVNPSKFPDEIFELFSIPAFDVDKPEVLKGCEIGSSKNSIRPSDVLLSKIVPHIRRCWVVSEKKEYTQIGSGEWIIFRDDRFFPKFLKYYLTSDGFHEQFMNTVAGVGGSLVRARPAFVEKIHVPFPPLKEQKRIAATLDKADAIRQKRKQIIRLADEFLRSVFLDMFGDVSSIGESTVEELAEDRKGSMRTGPFGSQLLHSEFTEVGISVLGIDNAVKNRFEWGKDRFISQEKYSELSRYTVFPGDVLITIMGTCGRCAVVPEDIPVAINTKHLCCITLDKRKCLPEFLQSYFLYHPVAIRYLEKNTKGAIMSGLNMGVIKAMPIPVFPLAMQKKYVEITKMVERSRQKRADFEVLGNTSFDSISQKAFLGQL